jgi:hypothetical protein
MPLIRVREKENHLLTGFSVIVIPMPPIVIAVPGKITQGGVAFTLLRQIVRWPKVGHPIRVYYFLNFSSLRAAAMIARTMRLKYGASRRASSQASLPI